MILTQEAKNKISTAVQNFFYTTDDPPPTFVTVDKSSIKQTPSGAFEAKVTTEVEYIPGNPMRHESMFKFTVNGKHEVKPLNWEK